MDFEAEGPAQISLRFEEDSERRQQLDALTEVTGNARLSQHFLALARDLDVMEAKLPEEVRGQHGSRVLLGQAVAAGRCDVTWMRGQAAPRGTAPCVRQACTACGGALCVALACDLDVTDGQAVRGLAGTRVLGGTPMAWCTPLGAVRLPEHQSAAALQLGSSCALPACTCWSAGPQCCLARDGTQQLTLEDAQVYKAHLTEGRAPAGPAVDSARANLAATFVNAFVNAGFGTDKLLTPEAVSPSYLPACCSRAAPVSALGGPGVWWGMRLRPACAWHAMQQALKWWHGRLAGLHTHAWSASLLQAAEEGSRVHWVFKNKDHGKAAAVASLGLITLWDVQGAGRPLHSSCCTWPKPTGGPHAILQCSGGVAVRVAVTRGAPPRQGARCAAHARPQP